MIALMSMVLLLAGVDATTSELTGVPPSRVPSADAAAPPTWGSSPNETVRTITSTTALESAHGGAPDTPTATTNLSTWRSVKRPYGWTAAGLAALILSLTAWLYRRRFPAISQHGLGNALAYGLGIALMAAQGLAVALFAVDVPMQDEWEYLRPPHLSHHFDWSWLLERHNEHQIFFTRLQTWALLQLDGWNVHTQILINFGMYAVLCFGFLQLLERRFHSPMGFILPLMASSVAWENHQWGFQSQFHFFLLFFLLAVYFVVQTGKRSWFGVLFAVCSIYSFSAGLTCAAAICLLLVLCIILNNDPWPRRCLQSLVTALMIAVWFYTKPPAGAGYHYPLTPPWNTAFWRHTFEIVSLGFGYNKVGVGLIPGAAITAAFVAMAGWRLSTWPQLSPSQRQAWLAWLGIVLGIGGAVLTIALGRASLPAWQAKSSRYAEVSLLLVAPFWLLLRRIVAHRIRWRPRAVLLMLGLALTLPFLHHYDYWRLYRNQRQSRTEALRCIQNYHDQGELICPTAYPGDIAARVIYAKTLGVSFTR